MTNFMLFLKCSFFPKIFKGKFIFAYDIRIIKEIKGDVKNRP